MTIEHDFVEYERTNRKILYFNFTNILLVISKDDFDDVYDVDTSFHSYYIVEFTSTPYTFKEYLNIYGHVIKYGGNVCEVNYVSNKHKLTLMCCFRLVKKSAQCFEKIYKWRFTCQFL